MPRAVGLASIAASSTFRPELITSTPGKPVVDVAAGRLAGIVEPLGKYYMHPLDISGPDTVLRDLTWDRISEHRC